MRIITCDGGLVRCVNSDDPALIGQEVVIVDYDTENGDSSDCHPIPQRAGVTVSAYVHKDEIYPAATDIVKFLETVNP
jgi:hypothetical protein